MIFDHNKMPYFTTTSWLSAQSTILYFVVVFILFFVLEVVSLTKHNCVGRLVRRVSSQVSVGGDISLRRPHRKGG